MFAVKRRRARLPLMVAALEAAAVATMGSTVFAQALTKEQPQAAPPGVVVIRAVGPHFSDEAIQYVAQNTLPTRFDNDIAATLQKKSARDVIAKMCGDLRRAYYSAFLSANGLDKLALDEPLGDRAGALVWPGCLYAKTFPDGFKTTVKEGDTASDIYVRQTGGGGSLNALAHYFKMSPQALNHIQADQVLVGSHVTAPVALRVKVDTNAFVASLARATARSEMAVVLRTLDPDPGEISIGFAQVASTNLTCRQPSAVPFNAAALQAAYQHAVARRSKLDRSVQGGIADVAIVDNGFYGADTSKNPKDPFRGSPFLKEFFARNPKTTIDRRLDFEKTASLPLNGENDVQHSTSSSHGTHVTGLVLGGPTLQPFRDAWLAAGRDPWLQITMFNVTRGQVQLIRGSSTALESVLQTSTRDRIVNLSLAHDGFADSDTYSIYSKLFTNGSGSLFVVAAGNRTRDVVSSRVYPAAHGGLANENVITVGAMDGDGGLAPFSNWNSRTVDLLAPGCDIESWASNTPATTRLSGSSQAAPQVTFVASLLRSIDGNATPGALKQRIVVSGDLLAKKDDSDRIAFRVSLNPVKALLLFDDYVTVSGSRAGTYLGSIKLLEGLQCSPIPNPSGNDLADFLAYKRNGSGGYVYEGRTSGRVFTPCDLSPKSNARLVFEATHRVNGEVISPVPAAQKELRLGIAEIQELIRRADPSNL